MASVLLGTGCSAGAGSHPAAARTSWPPDPPTASALLKIAAAFNREYGSGDYGPVYDRWDARSKAIISRAEYIRRHRECPAARLPSRTESVSRGPGRSWLVYYEIGGQQLTDHWYYSHRRWEFDLILSNPSAVRLYRMSARRYVAALGCAR